MESPSLRAEAAYYALLSRIGASLRHRFVGRLQPIGLTAALAGKQLDGVNVQNGRKSLDNIQRQTRDAMTSAIETLAWLTGEEADTVELKAGVENCVGLIRTDCGMRGVSIVSKVTHEDVLVAQRPLRVGLTAVLIALVDMQRPPSRLEVSSALAGDTMELNIALQFATTAESIAMDTGVRKLEWADVDALAISENLDIDSTDLFSVVKCRFEVVAARQGSVAAGSLSGV